MIFCYQKRFADSQQPLPSPTMATKWSEATLKDKFSEFLTSYEIAAFSTDQWNIVRLVNCMEAAKVNNRTICLDPIGTYYWKEILAKEGVDYCTYTTVELIGDYERLKLTSKSIKFEDIEVDKLQNYVFQMDSKYVKTLAIMSSIGQKLNKGLFLSNSSGEKLSIKQCIESDFTPVKINLGGHASFANLIEIVNEIDPK